MKEQHDDDKCLWLVTEHSRYYFDRDPYRFQICFSEEEARRVLADFRANETHGREYRIERLLVGPDGKLCVPLAQ